MRKIESINYGRAGAPIHAYITREHLERLAPFGLFDHFHGRVPHDVPGGIHPHSGIATLTYMLRGGLTHYDSNERRGLIPEGGLQWMTAGKGIWHDGAFQTANTGGMARDLQLWLRLPPELEMGTDYTHDIVEKQAVPVVGNTRVLLGEYEGVRGAIQSPLDVIYLHVSLNADETWDFASPEKYSRGFVYPFEGAGISAGETLIPRGAMGIFEDSAEAIRVRGTDNATEFVIALAEPFPHPAFAERGSIHTSLENLRESRRVIAELGNRIRRGA